MGSISIRKRASRKLPRLFRLFGGKCHWCGEKVEMARTRGRHAKGHWVIWFKNDKLHRARLATVDHVMAIRDGGDNDDSNLVLACANCNNNRHRTTRTTARPTHCACGNLLPPKKRAIFKCWICRFQNKLEWLVSLGWEVWPDGWDTMCLCPNNRVLMRIKEALKTAKTNQNLRPLLQVGNVVMWTDDSPETWRFIHTPGPMTVVSVWHHDGEPSDYARRFGVRIDPGQMCEVEYDADSTDYYNPPLSLTMGKRLTKVVHSKWLKLKGPQPCKPPPCTP